MPNKMNALFENGEMGSNLNRRASLFTKMMAVPTAGAKTVGKGVRNSAEYLAGDEAPELVKDHKKALSMLMMGGPVGYMLANSLKDQGTNALRGGRSLLQGFKGDINNLSNKKFKDMSDDEIQDMFSDTNKIKNNSNYKKTNAKIINDDSELVIKNIKNDEEITINHKRSKRSSKNRNTIIQPTPVYIVEPKNPRKIYITKGSKNYPTSYVIPKRIDTIYDKIDDPNLPLRSRGFADNKYSKFTRTMIGRKVNEKDLTKKDLLFITYLSKSIATNMEKKQREGIFGAFANIMGGAFGGITRTAVAAIPYLSLIKLVTPKAGRYKSQLPNAKRIGVFNSINATLGMIYTSMSLSLSETNRLIYALINVNKQGMGVDYKVPKPSNVTSISEAVGIGIRKFAKNAFLSPFRAGAKFLGLNKDDPTKAYGGLPFYMQQMGGGMGVGGRGFIPPTRKQTFGENFGKGFKKVGKGLAGAGKNVALSVILDLISPGLGTTFLLTKGSAGVLGGAGKLAGKGKLGKILSGAGKGANVLAYLLPLISGINSLGINGISSIVHGLGSSIIHGASGVAHGFTSLSGAHQTHASMGGIIGALGALNIFKKIRNNKISGLGKELPNFDKSGVKGGSFTSFKNSLSIPNNEIGAANIASEGGTKLSDMERHKIELLSAIELNTRKVSVIAEKQFPNLALMTRLEMKALKIQKQIEDHTSDTDDTLSKDRKDRKRAEKMGWIKSLLGLDGTGGSSMLTKLIVGGVIAAAPFLIPKIMTEVMKYFGFDNGTPGSKADQARGEQQSKLGIKLIPKAMRGAYNVVKAPITLGKMAYKGVAGVGKTIYKGGASLAKGAGSFISKLTGKEAEKIGGKVLEKGAEKIASKSVGKLIPGLNIAAGMATGGYFAKQKYDENDMVGAGLEALSGAAPAIGAVIGGIIGSAAGGVGAVPGAAVGASVGGWASMGVDLLILKRDLAKAQETLGKAEDKIEKGLIQKSLNVTETKNENGSIKKTANEDLAQVAKENELLDKQTPECGKIKVTGKGQEFGIGIPATSIDLFMKYLSANEPLIYNEHFKDVVDTYPDSYWNSRMFRKIWRLLATKDENRFKQLQKDFLNKTKEDKSTAQDTNTKIAEMAKTQKPENNKPQAVNNTPSAPEDSSWWSSIKGAASYAGNSISNAASSVYNSAKSALGYAPDVLDSAKDVATKGFEKATELGTQGMNAVRGLGDGFLEKLNGISEKLGLDPRKILSIMQFESGMNPQNVNKTSGASGLIQFMPSTAKDLGTDIQSIRNMSGIQQLDYVEKYFAPYAGKLKSLSDYYMAVLWPKAIGQSEDYPLFKQGTKAYEQNKNLDLKLGNADGIVTKAEAASKVAQIYQTKFNGSIDASSIGESLKNGATQLASSAKNVYDGLTGSSSTGGSTAIPSVTPEIENKVGPDRILNNHSVSEGLRMSLATEQSHREQSGNDSLNNSMGTMNEMLGNVINGITNLTKATITNNSSTTNNQQSKNENGDEFDILLRNNPMLMDLIRGEIS